MGRAALDEDAIRFIEESNPHLTFDWTRILKGHEAPPPEPRMTPPPRGRQRGRDRSRPEGRQPHPVVPGAKPPATVEAPGEPDTEVQADTYRPLSTDVERAAPPSEPSIADAHVISAPVMDVPESAAEEATTAAHARLGSEGLIRLRGRYSEILARISERISEPERRDDLKALAERLNPDAWVTEGEVQSGLEQYEAVFESLRAVVGRRRKQRRRRRSGRPAESAPLSSELQGTSPESAAPDGIDQGGEALDGEAGADTASGDEVPDRVPMGPGENHDREPD